MLRLDFFSSAEPPRKSAWPWLARRADHRSVCLLPRLPRCYFLTLELPWDVLAGSEAHFVRGLSTKRGMRWPRVVLRHVELDDFYYGARRVQRIQEEPVVLQHTPPGLNERVREGDVRHLEHSCPMGLHQR